jgi:microcystin-dependent protein
MARFFKYAFAVAGDVTEIPNTTQPSGSVSYQEGFSSNYQLPFGSNPNALPISRSPFNGILFDITSAIQEWQTQAIPNFITSSDNGGSPYPYPIYALVRYDDGGGMQVYENLVDNNLTTPGTDFSWQVVSGGSLGYKPGDFKLYAGGSLQSGFLFTDGAAVSRTTYARLFAAIGTLWGAGDGLTTFNVPNIQRRTLIGSGGTGSAVIGNAVGNIGGEEAHLMDISELVSHNHGAGTGFDFLKAATTSGGGTEGIQGTVSPLNYTPQPNTDNAGGGQAFNIIQPSAVALFMIKY